MRPNRKAQIFTWDIILATVIFLIVLGTILFLWTDTIEDITAVDTEYEIGWLATAVAEQLARTPGSPADWTSAPNIYNVTVFGLAHTKQIGNETKTLDRVLDPDKVVAFINYTQRTNGYSPLRNRIFGTGKYDFYVELSCTDPSSLDCFEGLKFGRIANYNITCNASNTTFYITNYSLKSDPALVATWRFDEGVDSVSADSSGGEKDATLHGAAWTLGKYGNAAYFDGTDDYVTASGPAVRGQYTVALWAKVTDAATRTILSTKDARDYGFDLNFRGGNEIHADIGNGAAWLTNYANVSISYTFGRWYHIACAVNQTGYRIYVDGAMAKAGTYAASTPVLFDENHTLTLGRNGTIEYFSGGLDEVRIWSRALSDAEILADYARDDIFCRFGRNTSLANVSYQMYDTKAVTFRKALNDTLFDDDTSYLKPTANLKVVVYRAD